MRLVVINLFNLFNLSMGNRRSNDDFELKICQGDI